MTHTFPKLLFSDLSKINVAGVVVGAHKIEDLIVCYIFGDTLYRLLTFNYDLGRRGQASLSIAVSKIEFSHSLIIFPQRFEFLQPVDQAFRSEEHTSELQSLMRISYAVFFLK